MDPSVVIAGLLGLLGSTWGAMIAGFYRGDFIPGHVYREALRENVALRKSVELLARRESKPRTPPR